MFYLCYTARRKNGRRHIEAKSRDVEYLIKLAANNNYRRYHIEIVRDWCEYWHFDKPPVPGTIK